MTRTVMVVAMLAASAGCTAKMPAGKEHTNTIGMKFVRIEAGSFQRGADKTPLPEELTGRRPHRHDGDFDEHPAHKVTISKPFYLGATEVTNVQYEQFDPEHRKLRGRLGFSKDDDEAVVFVSWHDAVRFCEWLSKKEGRPYRLPTEAEWEYACRAGTTTAFHTGEALPKEFHKNVRESWYPAAARGGDGEVVSLKVGQTPANAWGLYDMHGNVEEWCHDWYGRYEAGDQVDPVGRAEGEYRVTRGGSHSTLLYYLRSANRAGALPEDKHWLIGFRVVLGEMPRTKPLPIDAPPLWAQDVKQEAPVGKGPDPKVPYFKGPRKYVHIPAGAKGPLFAEHNHDPAIVDCPNGDLLAIWYSCVSEQGRELTVAASRLRHGKEEWEPAAPFWGPPDRNAHAPLLWHDGQGTLYHVNGVSVAATWGPLAVAMRTSKDSGATWSAARLIVPEHRARRQPVEAMLRTRDGGLLFACDAVPGGRGGTAVWLSKDGGKTWSDPGDGQPAPTFEAGHKGAWIAGIHAAVVELSDGRLLAFGRGDTINGRMPQSISSDGGKTWTYSAGPFPPIGGGQRCVLLRLREGPIFFASFTSDSRTAPRPLTLVDGQGNKRQIKGMFAALSFDDGKTWPHVRPIAEGPARQVETMDGRLVPFDENTGEPGGYLSVCQAADGVIHLISSQQHYAFNLAWLKAGGGKMGE